MGLVADMTEKLTGTHYNRDSCGFGQAGVFVGQAPEAFLAGSTLGCQAWGVELGTLQQRVAGTQMMLIRVTPALGGGVAVS